MIVTIIKKKLYYVKGLGENSQKPSIFVEFCRFFKGFVSK